MIKKGDIITHEYLGRGKVKKIKKSLNMALVLFDETPPIEYNMGNNPSLEFISYMIKEQGE